MTPAQLSALFEQLPTPTLVVDRGLRCVAANRAFLQLTGRQLDQLLGRDVFETFPNNPQNAALVRASFERVLATGKVDEIAAVATSNQRVWSARQAPIFGPTGEVELIVQETVEITQPTATNERDLDVVLERALRVQATTATLGLELDDLREMFRQAPGFTCFLRGEEHVFEIVNDAFRELINGRNVIGMRAREALPELEAQGLLRLLHHTYRSGETYVGTNLQVRLQRSATEFDEITVDVILQPIRTRTDEVVGIFVQGQDVTARRNAEARRRFLIEAMPVQVWTADPHGKLDFVSDRVVDYFQRSAEQILGDGWLGVLDPEDVDAVTARWTRSLETGEPYEVEFRLRRSDGEYRWHLGRANAERSSDGSITTWVGTNTDIHDAKSALAELMLRSQYEQRLIGIVSHDLRNPLSAIILASEVLANRQLDPATHKLVARMASAARRATRLVNDLLDFAKARLGTTIPVNPEPTNLRDILETVVGEFDVLAPGRVVQVGQSLDEGGLWDPDRLAQVLSNLVINALQHGAPGTPVYVEAKVTESQALLTVANQGRGIPAQDLDGLFEPYRRASNASAARGSLGLGLYIAREVVAAHGGTIDVESIPDELTRFTIRLPRFSAVRSSPGS